MLCTLCHAKARHQKSGVRVLSYAVVLFVGITTTGCRTTPHQQPASALPKRIALENEHLQVRSDMKLPKGHPLLQEMDSLRDDISEMLNLPVPNQPVTVYLFADEDRYAKFINARYPQLPARRAYFVGTAKELAVYTYWGEKIQEDLRHEYTHGVLHASLGDVPLWLDEGLAEYFEVASRPTGLNTEYAERLGASLANGWRPDLERLESLEDVGDMKKEDYQEAWAWVHFMLHHSDETRSILLSHLQDLRSSSNPPRLSAELRQSIRHLDERFASHAASLSSGIATVGGLKN